jgi:hypothetical protein
VCPSHHFGSSQVFLGWGRGGVTGSETLCVHVKRTLQPESCPSLLGIILPGDLCVCVCVDTVIAYCVCVDLVCVPGGCGLFLKLLIVQACCLWALLLFDISILITHTHTHT